MKDLYSLHNYLYSYSIVSETFLNTYFYNCWQCKREVLPKSWIKYCVRFGSNLRQFCKRRCLATYKANAEFCPYCGTDYRKRTEYYKKNYYLKHRHCSQTCLDYRTKREAAPTVDPTAVCSFCRNASSVFQYVENQVPWNFCGDSCFYQHITSINKFIGMYIIISLLCVNIYNSKKK